MSPPESCYGLWYHPEINRFTDEDDTIVCDITELFNIWRIRKWIKTKQNGFLQDTKGDWYELYYVDPAKKCNHICELCKNTCPVYLLWRDWMSELYFEGSI